MNSRAVTWGIVAVLAGLFIWWQYSNYAHNNQLNTNLGNVSDLNKQVAAASELIDKKQFGDVLPTTPEYVHYRVINALYGIVHRGTPKARATEALNQLVSLVKDSDVGVRYKAMRYLVLLGPAAIPGVIPALKDGDQHARNGAVSVLDRIGDKSIPALVDAVITDKDERAAAIDALVALKPAPDAQMLKLLSNKDKDVRSAAATYFGNSGEKIGEDPILKLLQDKDVRPAAIRAEGLLGDKRALPEIEKALTAQADAGNRRTAIVALGDMKAVSAIPMIVPFLSNSDPDIQGVTVVALNSMGPAGIPALDARFAKADPLTRKGIAESLRSETDPAAIALLTQALHDSDPGVRKAAAASLGAVQDKRAIAPLIAALRDPSPDVAENAVQSLSQIGAPAVPALVKTLGTAPAGQELAVANAAGSSNSGSTSMPFSPAVVAPYYASKALVDIGTDAGPAVIQAAQSGTPDQRKWAVITLADLRVPGARGTLENIVKNGSPSLKWFAQDSLLHYPLPTPGTGSPVS